MSKNTVAQNKQLILDAAARYGIDAAIALAQIQQESSFNDQARSSAGALGLAQMLPSTAASLGIDPLDPDQAADGWGRLMSQYLAQFGNDYIRALISYHSGPGAVEGVLRNPAGNPLTTAYYKNILASAGRFRKSLLKTLGRRTTGKTKSRTKPSSPLRSGSGEHG